MSLVKFLLRLLFVVTTEFKGIYQLHENLVVQVKKSLTNAV